MNQNQPRNQPHDYSAIYRNTGKVPRDLNEAERNATYAQPLWYEKTRSSGRNYGELIFLVFLISTSVLCITAVSIFIYECLKALIQAI